jgi:TolA-binding protein
MKMQQYDQAEEAVKRALESQPEGRLNGEARLAMGDIELRRGQFEDAAKTFSSVALLYDDPAITPVAIHKASKAFEKAGDDRKARRMEEKLEEDYPDFSYDPATIEDQFMTNVRQG